MTTNNSMGPDISSWVPNLEGEDLKEPLPIKSKSELSLIKLYQAEASPPCVMVRALLRYADVNFETVNIDFMMKSEISWSTYKKIPIITVNGYQVNDSYIIFKVLAPLLFGRAISDAESAQIKSVSYGAMIAFEAELFENSEATSKFIDGFVAKDCCSAVTVGPLAKLFMSQAPAKIREKNPDLQPFKTHCESFKAAIKGKFAGGSEPGPYDVMMYALFAIFKHVKIDMFDEMWKQVGLTDWYDGMDKVMSSKKPLFE